MVRLNSALNVQSDLFIYFQLQTQCSSLQAFQKGGLAAQKQLNI